MAQLQGIRGKKHDRICRAILLGLRNNGYVKYSYNDRHVIDKMLKTGLVTRVGQGLYKLDMEVVRASSYIVTDELWENLGDVDFQRKLKGLDPEKAEAKTLRNRAFRDEKRVVRAQNKGKKPMSNASFDLSNIVIGGSHGKDTI